MDSYAPEGFTLWRGHLRAQLEHLAAAVSDGLPGTYARHVAWTRLAFATREVEPEDLQAGVLALRAVLEEELPPVVGTALAPCFEAGLAALEGAIRGGGAIDTSTTEGELAAGLVADLLSGNPAAARARMSAALEEGGDPRRLREGPLLSALHELGRLWHVGEVGVAEEHFATGELRRMLARTTELASPAESNGFTVLVAGVSGDAHDLGVQLVAGSFALEGWRSLDLGADVPAADLALASQRFEADLVVLSATLEDQRATVARTVSAIRGVLPDLPILVGGGGFDADPASWEATGASGYTPSASEATEEGLRLVQA